MRHVMLLVFGLFLCSASLVLAAPPADVAQFSSCRHCGMDRGKFSQSRMLIEYDDGSKVATCSLHCAAVELAGAIDKTPARLLVADFDGGELLDAEKAVWVMGGTRKGVMTTNAKWAFATREGADRFIRAGGGSVVTFDEAIRAAYDDMYKDTRMIRERRMMMKKMKQQGGTGK